MSLKKEMQEKFKKYVFQFDMQDENISRKYFHSLRVMDFAEKIAMSEGLDQNNIEIATVVGLLHDYARFEQWKKYHTYSDIDSIDHADLAVNLLFENNEIMNFYKNIKNYDEIYDGIKYHNKCNIPEYLSDHNLYICKIIRDADKLDIFNLIIEDKIGIPQDASKISSKVEKEFFEGKNINYIDVKNNNDNIILKLAMFFDINFKYSYEYIMKNNILWKLFEKIEDKNKFKKYFDFVEKYLINNGK